MLSAIFWLIPATKPASERGPQNGGGPDGRGLVYILHDTMANSWRLGEGP